MFLSAGGDYNDRMLPFIFDLPETSLVLVDKFEQLSDLKSFLSDSIIVGIDTERKPDHSRQVAPHPTALIQIAARTSDGSEKVFLVDIQTLMTDSCAVIELKTIFQNLLASENCIKLGQGLVRDLVEIMTSFPALNDCFLEVNALIDTESLYRNLQPEAIHMISLKKLVRDYLHLNLIKTEQMSDWSIRPLTFNQMYYAANDALCLLRLHDAMVWEIQDKYVLEEEGKDFDVKEIYQSLNMKEQASIISQLTEQWKRPSPSKKSKKQKLVSLEKGEERIDSPVTVAASDASASTVTSVNSQTENKRKRLKVSI